MRLLGVWPLDPAVKHADACEAVWLELAKLCGDHDVLPEGGKAVTVFASRMEALHSALMLDVPAARLLDLAEKLGLHKGVMFIAAAVDVRRASSLFELAA